MSAVLPADLEGATRLLDAGGLSRTLLRLAHEVQERHARPEDVVLAAIEHGGVPVARLAAELLTNLYGVSIPVLALDVSAARDDRPRATLPAASSTTALPAASSTAALYAASTTATEVSIDGRVVVLVDDVVHTGRTLRAALDVLTGLGRAAAVEPLVLIDRGHRELPLRATYVGRNLPVGEREWVKVLIDGVPAELTGAWRVQR